MAKSGAKTKTVSQPVVQPATSPTWKKIIGGVLLALGMITFLLAQSAVWVNNSFFNENNFVGTVESVLSTEESREAIASTIVHSALQNNPVAEQLIGQRVTSIVTGFLGSDLANQLFNRVAHRSYAYLTSSDRQDVAINLTSIKDPLTTIIGIAEKNGRDVKFDPANIPDTITLIDSDSLPDISRYIQIVLLSTALLWFLAIASFGTYMYLYRSNIIRSIYLVGASIIAISLVALFTGPFVPQAIASLVGLIGIRGIVEDLATAFIAPFTVQLLSGVVITALVLLIVNLRGAIRQGVVKLVSLFNK